MAHLWRRCDGKVAMSRRDGIATRTLARKDEVSCNLVVQQIEMFERIDTRLESMDARLLSVTRRWQ